MSTPAERAAAERAVQGFAPTPEPSLAALTRIARALASVGTPTYPYAGHEPGVTQEGAA
jgi:hypothetical protein